VAHPSENARLYFDQFKVRSNDSTIFYGSHCQEDWVEIFNVYPGGKEVLLGRYCGESTPGPVESDPGTTGLKVSFFLYIFFFKKKNPFSYILFFMKVVLRTDEEGVFNGFKARYTFDESSSINRGIEFRRDISNDPD